MAKPNYAFAKRQKDLAKKQKQEEKQRRKAEAKQQAARGEGSEPETAEAPEAEEQNDD